MTRTFLGVDLGGTGTRIVRTTAAGAMLADRSVPTETDPATAVPALIRHLREVGAEVDGIGVGASGPIDTAGVIRNPDTLPAYTGVDLAAVLGAEFGVPVVVDNDAVTAAYGEVRLGAGRGAHSVLMVTLGTGVGVALLTGGRPLRTAAGLHPEAGHLWMPGHAPCYCGRSSCWEQQASRATLQRALAGAGDEAAVFEGYGRAVGRGLADLVAVLGPERIVLGGGGARFLDRYRTALSETAGPVPVVPTELGDLAGAAGAALLAAKHNQECAQT